jgi:aldehyde dehydrogenase
MDQSALIQAVVREVLSQLGTSNIAPRQSGGNFGVFKDVNQAVEAAKHAHSQLSAKGVKVRDAICKMIKRIGIENAESWGKIELEETKVGRLDHKIEKLQWLAGVPGVEFLKTVAHSGDDGIGLDEAASWGVIGVVTPVTHSIPTLSANAINMIAAGNALVINAHPSGYKCAVMAVRTYNKAIAEKFGIEDLICIIDPPTLDSANAIFAHPDIPLLAITGGPAVARAAMAQQKRAVVGGPGNPPVVVDETADLDKAAKAIIAGASFDNNLLCIAEKEVFVVEKVFDKMMDAMARAGAVRLNAGQIDALAKKCFVWKDNHWALQKEAVGRDAWVLAEMAGVSGVGKNVDLLYGETDESSPFVSEEQMMPFVPFVRVPNFDRALELAVKHEHGFGHTAIIHSNNLANITRMGRVMNTTLFVVNGPCTAALGGGGEGYPSYTIATPTGEGVTNPLTFTRFRRLTVAGSLRVV